MLFLVRHAESVENATKYTGFCGNPRPWTGPAAHALFRDVVGLTPRGFLQCLWLRQTLRDLTGPDPAIRTSQYRRALDTAELALPGLPYEVTALLNEQHYGAATYMTKRELYATYPEGAEDRQTRKHLWTPPGVGGESLAGGVLSRAMVFVDGLDTVSATDVVAFTHHTAKRTGFLHRYIERSGSTAALVEDLTRGLPPEKRLQLATILGEVSERMREL